MSLTRPGADYFFKLLMNSAEHGRLPDSAIRYGIRRLLKSRLSNAESSDNTDEVRRFVARSSMEHK